MQFPAAGRLDVAFETCSGTPSSTQGWPGPAPVSVPSGNGRTHVVESSKETVRLGVFDATLPPIVTIESCNCVSFTNTWSHFMNELQPGVPISRLAELRTSNPGRRPHSIIGPIAVNDAEPGDLVEIRYRRLHPVTWGAVFNDPAALGTGPAAAGFLARPDQIRRSRLGEDEGEVRPPTSPFR